MGVRPSKTSVQATSKKVKKKTTKKISL